MTEILRRMSGRDAPNRLGPEAREEEEPAAQTPAERSTFDRWFDLVTDPEHVRSELQEFPAAWAGAMRFAGGGWP